MSTDQQQASSLEGTNSYNIEIKIEIDDSVIPPDDQVITASVKKEAETVGGLQIKQEPPDEVDKPIDLTSLYTDHKIKDEMVIGPPALQKLDTPYIWVNSIGADIGRHQNRVCIYPNQRPNHSEQSENSNGASLATQSLNRAVKVEPQVLDGDIVKREGAFGGLNVSSVDGHQSGMQQTWSSDDPYKLKVEVIKVEIDPLADAEPNIENGEGDPEGTTHSQRCDPNNAKDKPFSCDVCHKRFSEKSNLKKHFMVHTKEKPYSCDICKKQFSRNCYLKIHVMVHTKEKPHSCDVCEKQFSNKCNLKRHLMIHKTEKPFSCNICNKQFREKRILKIHLMIHTKEKPYTCDICNMQFNLKYRLKKHAIVHTKEKSVSCDICNKQFSGKCNLKKHLMVHSKEKPYSCDVCNKRFSAQWYLRTHLLIHRKEKPYSCNICNKQFNLKYPLKRHLLIHTKDKSDSVPVRKKLLNI